MINIVKLIQDNVLCVQDKAIDNRQLLKAKLKDLIKYGEYYEFGFLAHKDIDVSSIYYVIDKIIQGINKDYVIHTSIVPKESNSEYNSIYFLRKDLIFYNNIIGMIIDVGDTIIGDYNAEQDAIFKIDSIKEISR